MNRTAITLMVSSCACHAAAGQPARAADMATPSAAPLSVVEPISASLLRAGPGSRGIQADVVSVYQNLSSFTGVAFPHGSDATLDDVTPIGDGGGRLATISFTLANLGTAGVYTGGDVTFLLAERDPDGGPGATILELRLALDALFGGVLQLGPGQIVVATVGGFEVLGLDLPEGGYFVGLAFEEAGGADSVEVLGQGVYDPAALGSSEDGIVTGGVAANFGGTPPANLGWQIGVLSDLARGDYEFDLVPVPSLDLSTFNGGLAINNLGQVAVPYASDDQVARVYLGTASGGRVHEAVEAFSDTSLGYVSLNDDGMAFYNAVFDSSGFDRGGYRVPVSGGTAAQVTGSDPFVSAPVLFGGVDGGMAGKVTLFGSIDSGRYLVSFGPGPLAPALILAGPAGSVPGSDVEEVDIFCTSANGRGQVVALVHLVGGGSQLRRYDPDGGGFTVIASDRAADPASPIFEIERLSTPAINNRGEVVFIAESESGAESLYAFDGAGLRELLSPEDLAVAGIPRVRFQDLALSDRGVLAFVATPNFIGQSSSISLYTATLDGQVTEVRHNGLQRPPLDTIDAGPFEISSVEPDVAINNRGEILFSADVITPDGIDDYVFVARPAGVPACPFDLAAPGGELDFFDVAAFIDAFLSQELSADLAAPLGVWDYFDISAYVRGFNAGCP